MKIAITNELSMRTESMRLKRSRRSYVHLKEFKVVVVSNLGVGSDDADQRI
jgi:hypothetical protein